LRVKQTNIGGLYFQSHASGYSLYNLHVSTGIGTWGLNKTVGWAWDIKTSFGGLVSVHAGTLICGITLFRQRWRMAINRSAEAMTIFSVIQAGLFPIIHGPWLAYGFCLYQLVLCG
jgi:molybdopterin-containing oxidoreductase family membrane subunit